MVAWQAELDPFALDLHARLVRGNDDADARALDDRGDRGVTLLAAAAVWALVFAALYARRLPDLGLAVGVAALALAAVGTADLLSVAALSLPGRRKRLSSSRSRVGSAMHDFMRSG